ncbi:MAG: DUF4440 domain-containing protein [Planctomycetota bacterium]
MSDPRSSTIYPSLTYDDASAAIDWLERVFGFRRRLVVAGEQPRVVVHSELSFGSAVIMVSSPRPDEGRFAPSGVHGLSQTLSLYVDDPDAHFEKAEAAGVEIVRPLADEAFGARGYMAKDLEGHVWYFANYRPGGHWESSSETAAEFMARYVDASQRHDLDALRAMVAPDAVYFFSNGGVHRGRDEVIAAIERNFGAIEAESYEVMNLDWLVDVGESAAAVFDYRWSGKIAGEPASGSGRGSCVLRWSGDDWTVVQEHLSAGCYRG